MKSTLIQTAISDHDIASCWEAMSLLRPMLVKADFVQKIKSMQREGYTLLYIVENESVVSVAGYRIYTMLYCGRLLYIDDLSTIERSRGKGYASMLLNHLRELARQLNCQSLQLDSGPMRTTAHKLYYRENFTINAFHFSKTL